ncbi:MAG: sigma-70 family RNA polymerase sigma factor, partial [Opitutaceae bacterium]|nr:sigma-70 family RNA polymerase sigma factor [Opitutaceae bacterium]
MTTDHELLQRYARDRAEDAFATLVERHLPLVYGTALRRLAGDAHLAQDVAQGVFVDLARKAASLGPRETLAGWLYFATHRAAAQAVRTEQRRRTREQKAHAMQLHLAEGSADWEQARPVLDAALQELNESDRDAVLRRFFARQPFSAIGAELRVSEDAARMRVDRALEKLRRALEHRGVTSTHAALATALATSATAAVPAGMAEAVTSAAVAGGSTAVAGAAAGFFAMNTPVIVGSVVLLATGARVYRHQQLAQAEERVAALTRERDALHAAGRQAKAPAAAAERALSFKPAARPESTKTDRS